MLRSALALLALLVAALASPGPAAATHCIVESRDLSLCPPTRYDFGRGSARVGVDGVGSASAGYYDGNVGWHYRIFYASAAVGTDPSSPVGERSASAYVYCLAWYFEPREETCRDAVSRGGAVVVDGQPVVMLCASPWCNSVCVYNTVQRCAPVLP